MTTTQLNRGDALVLMAALIWGVAFYFQKTAMWHIGPILFIGIRGLIAGFVLIPFAIMEYRKQSVDKANVARLAKFVVLGGVVFSLAGVIQQMGLVHATVVNTGLLTALYVVLTPFIYWAVKRQIPGRSVWLCVALAATGIWALSGGSIAQLSSGDRLVAGAAVFWSLHLVITGEAAKTNLPITYTCLQFLVVAAIILPVASLFEVVEFDAIVAALDSILYVGILSSAFTFGIVAVALQYIPATRVSLLMSVEVVFAAGAGYLLLGERLTPLGWGGALLILSAVVLVRRRQA